MPAGEGIPASVRQHLTVEPWFALPCILKFAQTSGSVRWPSDEKCRRKDGCKIENHCFLTPFRLFLHIFGSQGDALHTGPSVPFTGPRFPLQGPFLIVELSVTGVPLKV